VENRTPARPSQALPKATRIARRAEFLRTYESGRKYFSRFCVLFVLDNQLAHSRLGITATRKIGKANVRNRIKRWIREVYRTERVALGLDLRHCDYVVNIKPTAATAEFADFKRDLTAALRRATPDHV